MSRLLKLFRLCKTRSTPHAEKPKLSGGFIGGVSTLTCVKYSHMIPECGLEPRLQLSEEECKELFLPKGIEIPVIKEPCKGYSVFVYRVDENMGIDKVEGDDYSVVWQDSLLLFYCIEYGGIKYVVFQYHAITGDDFEISKPIPQRIKEFSGSDLDYFDLWSEIVTVSYLIDLDGYAVEKKR